MSDNMDTPLKYVQVCDKFKIDGENGVFNATAKMVTYFAEKQEEYIFSEIVNMARENGVTDLFILDKDYILQALKEKQKREKMCDECKHDDGKNESYECYECTRSIYCSDNFEPKEATNGI